MPLPPPPHHLTPTTTLQRHHHTAPHITTPHHTTPHHTSGLHTGKDVVSKLQSLPGYAQSKYVAECLIAQAHRQIIQQPGHLHTRGSTPAHPTDTHCTHARCPHTNHADHTQSCNL